MGRTIFFQFSFFLEDQVDMDEHGPDEEVDKNEDEEFI